MAATWSCVDYYSTGPSERAWTDNARFHKAETDVAGDVSATAVVIPAAGTNYSWAKALKSKWTTAPAGKIMNLRVFTSGSAPATGVDILYLVSGTWTQPSSAQETVAISATAITGKTSASPLAINAGDVLVGPSTGVGTQDYLYLQMSVGTTASPGNFTNYALTWRYDES